MSLHEVAEVVRNLSPAGAIVAWIFTVWKYLRARSDSVEKEAGARLKEARARLAEAQRPFMERQLELYFEGAEVAAKLATLDEGDERGGAIQRFWQLYWGPMSVVEDQAVEDAMVAVGEALDKYQQLALQDRTHGSREKLRRRSLALARAFRRSIEARWTFGLPDLEARNGPDS